MSGLLQLASDMDVLAAKLGSRASEIAKETASTVLQDLAQVTPVDVGEALSNWQVSLDTPNLQPIPAHIPSKRGRMKDGVWTHSVEISITRAANAPPTLDAGLSIIAAKKPGQSILISNATEHIDVLDTGTSDQEPAGFVDRAVILGRNVVEKSKLL